MTNAVEEEMFGQLAELVTMQRAEDIYAENFGGLPEAGTACALSHIHRRLYGGLLPDAGQWRTSEACNAGIVRYVKAAFIPAVMPIVERMPHGTFEEAADKFLEIMLVHPFSDGNGHAMRLWLDQMLAASTGKRVRWSGIRYSHYLLALRRSASDASAFRSLLRDNLADIGEPCRAAFAVRDMPLHYEGPAECRIYAAADSDSEGTAAGFLDMHIRIPSDMTPGLWHDGEIRQVDLYADGCLL